MWAIIGYLPLAKAFETHQQEQKIYLSDQITAQKKFIDFIWKVIVKQLHFSPFVYVRNLGLSGITGVSQHFGFSRVQMETKIMKTKIMTIKTRLSKNIEIQT